ncbi:MAG: hypothetical protein KTR20_13985 [Cellvibrionaceae bacterium]|nr:hypothetical protein [Cellvibrionaceae bacterium]
MNILFKRFWWVVAIIAACIFAVLALAIRPSGLLSPASPISSVVVDASVSTGDATVSEQAIDKPVIDPSLPAPAQQLQKVIYQTKEASQISQSLAQQRASVDKKIAEIDQHLQAQGVVAPKLMPQAELSMPTDDISGRLERIQVHLKKRESE